MKAAMSGLNNNIIPNKIAIIFKRIEIIWKVLFDFSTGVTLNILKVALIINQIANK